MLASKLKMVADKYNQSLQTKKETEIYIFLMKEMEEQARAGRYKYCYDYDGSNPPCRINSLIEMLVKEGYRVYTRHEDYTGLEIMTISWEDLRNE